MDAADGIKSDAVTSAKFLSEPSSYPEVAARAVPAGTDTGARIT